MNEATQTHPSYIKRIINIATLIYLIVMGIYPVLRLVVGDGGCAAVAD